MNNNNRCNGQSVRLVQDFTPPDTLLVDIFRAYYDARRNKRNTPSQLRFELDLESNLVDLYHDLRARTYFPSPSICFIIEDPVKREVFASEFRDRVVHHLYNNYVAHLFERQFIYDSYSCRLHKGTLCGIKRLEHHIRSVSHNYTRKAFMLKLDIQGYFMSISRSVLHTVVLNMLSRVRIAPEQKDIVYYLTDVFTQKNPLQGCRRKGNLRDWDDLPHTKCMSYSPIGVGMPIGDLTSQLFSNVLLNQLDWYITRDLGFRHYGRYVDDFYIIDEHAESLRAAIPKIRLFLHSLGLTLHPKKISLEPVTLPKSFLGAVVRPYYRHCSARTLQAYRKHLAEWKNQSSSNPMYSDYLVHSMNSYLGYLSHFATANITSQSSECKNSILLSSPTTTNSSLATMATSTTPSVAK